MIPARELLKEAEALPVEERVILVDALLKTLNTPDQSIDKAWMKTAGKRLKEMTTGKARSVPAQDVFENAGRRLKK
ncbi:MAG: addiction module protein [Chitinivibrionales bacterium]|nr:addiction module protein [Chitinivibrionales bacterium]